MRYSHIDDLDAGEKVEAGAMRPWDVAELPEPPAWKLDLRRIIGPGLMMAGAAIGGGEWLMGPTVTAKYGGAIMWIAAVSILLQASYNLEVMRYALYCGEPIFVGFFRTAPGPKFWAVFYLILDFGAAWPYLAANAAIPLMAAFLGHLPTEADRHVTQWIAYAIFLGAFVPLIFGGKIYNAIERVMVVKIFLVLGYLLFLGIFYVEWATWVEVFGGFLQIGWLPTTGDAGWFELISAAFRNEKTAVDLTVLAAFAAIAGQGGLTNTAFSNYTRDKGWGMGSLVGAIPSAIGGRGVALAHNGKVFTISPVSLQRWRRWRWITIRDQLGIWVLGCLLGVGIPAMVSLQFVRGQDVPREAVAAMTAQGLVDATGVRLFWFLTLFCGFVVLAPSQVTTIDGLVRRWTDVLWTGSRRLGKLEGDKVAYVYYLMLLVYAIWGFIVLTFVPDKLAIVKISTGILYNFALGFSSLHTLFANCVLMPKALRPNWFMRLALVACAVFFMGISALGVPQALRDLGLR